MLPEHPSPPEPPSVPAPPPSPPPRAADDADRRRKEEDLWRTLLSLIDAGEVVPIVGRELLHIGPDRSVHLYTWLAERVAPRLGVKFDSSEPTKDPLNTVACRYLTDHDDWRKIYVEVFEEAREMFRLAGDLPGKGVPDAFIKLAAIDTFKLFVTTTFDPSLETALNKVRFKDLSGTVTCRFAPQKAREDLPQPIEQLQQPTIFHLLGRMSPINDYVVTDEDALEFVHWLQKSPPERLFAELYQKDLLVIGCRFPAWLVRSFIRLSRPDRLRQIQERTVFVVDSGAREDQSLIDFLRTFKTRTEVFEHQGPIEFVDELHERWTKRRQAPGARAPLLDLAGPPPGAIFVSYASEDREIARQVVQALRGGHLEAWFDEEQLMVGDRFLERIQAGIRRSLLFLPLLSKHSGDRSDRYFRHEWHYAFQRAVGLPSSVEFVYPWTIDREISYDDERLPPPMRHLKWGSLIDGITPEFVNSVRERYKRNQGG